MAAIFICLQIINLKINIHAHFSGLSSITRFSMGTVGPHQYTGKDMKVAHENLGIGKRDFQIANEDTIPVMKEHGYNKELINEVIGILDSMQGDVITK